MEFGYALYEDHIIISLAREGSNLISRQTDSGGGNGLAGGDPSAYQFRSDRKIIFSVVKVGTAEPILTSRSSFNAALSDR